MSFKDQGLLRKRDALAFKRYWEARGHSVQLDKVHGGLFRVYLKLNKEESK